MGQFWHTYGNTVLSLIRQANHTLKKTMKEDTGINQNENLNSSALSASVRSTPIAPSQSQQISITDRPVLKLRDPAADQRTQASKQGHAQRAKDFLAEAQQIEEELDQMLHVRSRRLADAISAAPFRFDELFVERANAHNYDYSEIEATNAAIRDMWKD